MHLRFNKILKYHPLQKELDQILAQSQGFIQIFYSLKLSPTIKRSPYNNNNGNNNNDSNAARRTWSADILVPYSVLGKPAAFNLSHHHNHFK